MKRLPSIPTPAAQHWREIKIKFVPFLVFVATASALGYLWREHVSAPTLIGQVEPIQADVLSTEAGTLAILRVTRFQPVKAGDAVAEIKANDPKSAAGQIQNLRGKAALNQLELNAVLDRERNAFNYQRLRLDLLREKVDLATYKVKLRQADSELKREAELFQQKLISDAEYDLAIRAKETLEVQASETAKLVEDMERAMTELKLLADVPGSLSTNSISSREMLSSVHQEKGALPIFPFEPIILRAPIDGVVTIVHRRAGENVTPGDPIVTISATEGERIVSYLRQPLLIEPKIGMPVQIRRRTARREEATARILNIGRQFESIAPALQRPGMLNELGLPIAVSLPASIKLDPAELVELTIKK